MVSPALQLWEHVLLTALGSGVLGVACALVGKQGALALVSPSHYRLEAFRAEQVGDCFGVRRTWADVTPLPLLERNLEHVNCLSRSVTSGWRPARVLTALTRGTISTLPLTACGQAPL